MSSSAQTRKAARAERRAQRRAAREARRRERDAAAISASLTATPDDTPTTPSLIPAQQVRRRRAFELLERTHSELVVAREHRVLALLAAAPGTDEHTELGRDVEALNDEIDDLRELSDELLRRVAPLDLADDRLARLEQLLGAAQALANASARAQALLGAAQELLTAIDEAIDSKA